MSISKQLFNTIAIGDQGGSTAERIRELWRYPASHWICYWLSWVQLLTNCKSRDNLDRQTDTQTVSQKDRQAGRQVDRQKDRQTNRQTWQLMYLKDDVLFAIVWNVWYYLSNASQESQVWRKTLLSWITTEWIHNINYHCGWVFTVLLAFLFSKCWWNLLWIWSPSTESTINH